MAMLAEQRSRKQKWSIDPNGSVWSKDTEKFGYKMLEKMGWSAGKGLGMQLDGNTSHVKLANKKDTLGIGAKRSWDQDWLETQNSFNDVLSRLNANHAEGIDAQSIDYEKKEREEKRQNNQRLFYSKFRKNKDASRYGTADMACILGVSPATATAATTISDNSEEVEEEEKEEIEDKLIINAGVNMNDYFAQRLLERKAAMSSTKVNVTSSDSNNVGDKKKTKKKKDKKKKSVSSDELKSKEKKKKKSDDDDDDDVSKGEDKEKKKKKKKKVDVIDEVHTKKSKGGKEKRERDNADDDDNSCIKVSSKEPKRKRVKISQDVIKPSKEKKKKSK